MTISRDVAKPELRSCAFVTGAVMAPVIVVSSLFSAAPVWASEQRCNNGTLLQIQVNERGTTRSDRFGFNLGLEAEADTKAAAMELLNARLDQAKRAVKRLAMGKLTIPAPTTYRTGGWKGTPRRERATTRIGGEVSRANYDALIQAAGGLPGVRLQGMTSLASSTGSMSLEEQLLEQALEQGRRRAESTAQALGLRRVDLLRIDQRNGGYRPFMRTAALAAPTSFNPEEAPQPSQSLRLMLDYCLR
ncbi:MAG: SIMPL domain-containing protein [Synechococcus sp.]